MKRFINCLVLTSLFIFLTTAIGFANYSCLNRVQGNWYDHKGNLVLSIHNGYINGCKVINEYNAVGGDPGSCTFRIVENAGYRDINLSWHGYDIHRMVTMDNDKTLYSTSKPQYFESIGGIYLGMNKDDLLYLYGKPSKIKTYNYGRTDWIYSKLGLTYPLKEVL